MSSAVILISPKFPLNVGNSLRGCAIFGADELVWTGHRFQLADQKRLPREERMRTYNGVKWYQDDNRPISKFIKRGYTPVCVEVRAESEPLTTFQHPEDAVYIFGPEDGSIGKGWLHVCHRFVHIPSHGCLNLASAVNVVLYDRRAKRQLLGIEKILPLPDMLTLTREHLELNMAM